MSDDIIKRALGMDIESTEDDAKAIVPYVVENNNAEESQADSDINFARENMIELIAKGSEALDELIMIAKQSQHPRAFEVIANLLKTTADLNSDLIAVHKKRKDISEKNSQNNNKTPGTVNNNLFVGSTAELQRFLANMNKDKNNE